MKKDVPALTSLRFFAAAWVLLYHLRNNLGSELPVGLEQVVQCGPMAMTFFFVLSGFVLVVASQGENPWDHYPRYAYRRFARIYPLYLASLIIFWVMVGFAKNTEGSSWPSLLALGFSDISLTGAWFPQAFMGGFGRDGTWSLSVELFCYALFPSILFISRQLSCDTLRRAVTWSVVLAALGPIMGRHVPPSGAFNEVMFYSMPIFRLPEFAAGVFYADWTLRDSSRVPSGPAVAWRLLLLVAFLLLFARVIPFGGCDIALVPFLLALFAHTLSSEQNFFLRTVAARPFVFLGEISYGIYLMQIITIAFYARRSPGPHGYVELGMCFALTIMLAAIGRYVIEKPARLWVLRMKGGVS